MTRDETAIRQDIEAAIGAAQYAKLAELEMELQTLPARRRAERLEEIDAELATLGQEVASARVDLTYTIDVQKALWEEMHQARERWEVSRRPVGLAQNAYDALRRERRALEDERAQLVHEIKGDARRRTAPLVRSLPHASFDKGGGDD